MAAKYYIPKSGQQVKIGGLAEKPLNRVIGLADQGKFGRANKVYQRQKNKGLLSQPTAATPTAAAPAVAAPTPVAAAPAQQAAPSNANTLFPNSRMFEPQNYEGSPLYKFQVQQGQKQLGKSLASRGLTNSGYGIEQELNIPLRAAAQDTERMQNVAMDNANRLQSMQENEAMRLERQGNNQWNRMYQTAGLLAQQSPWQAAVNGLDNSANALNNRGQDQMNFLKDFYQKQFAPAMGPMAVTPPQSALPTAQPNFVNTQVPQLVGEYSQGNQWAQFIKDLLMPTPAPAATGAK